VGLDVTLKIEENKEVIGEVEFNCSRHAYAVEDAINDYCMDKSRNKNNGKDILVANTLTGVLENLEEVMFEVARRSGEEDYKPYEILEIIKDIVRNEDEYTDVKLYVEYWF